MKYTRFLGPAALCPVVFGLGWLCSDWRPAHRGAQLWEIPMSASHWHEIYNGYGSSLFDSKDGIVLQPKPPRQISETHASLILAKKTEIRPLKDFVLMAQVSTDDQLRRSKPNPWEVLWIFFNCRSNPPDPLTTNYLILKPNGIELGKAFKHTQQKILFTRNEPKLTLGKIYSITLIKVGSHVDLLVDGAQVLSTSARNLGFFDQPGAIGIYTEDAKVHLYHLSILPLNQSPQI